MWTEWSRIFMWQELTKPIKRLNHALFCKIREFRSGADLYLHPGSTHQLYCVPEIWAKFKVVLSQEALYLKHKGTAIIIYYISPKRTWGMQRLTQLPLDRDHLKESWELHPDFQNFEAVISSHDTLILVTGASEQWQLWEGHCQTWSKPSRGDIYAHLAQCSISLWKQI